MKKKIFALLALVCMTLTASADVVPTYALTKATDAEAHGTITFKVGENTVTSAAEGQTVTVAIEPNTGWSVGGLQGLWYAAGSAVKAPKRVQAGVDLLKDFELEPVTGNPNAFTFVMKRANAEISVSYRKQLTVTAEDATVFFGNEMPAFTVSYEGFVNGETESVLGGTLAFSCDYTTESPVGSTFAIKPSGLTSDNYDIIFVDGTLTVVVDYKETLQTAIAIASNINPEGLADAITAAQAALNDENATVESLAQAAQTLEAAIKTYFGEVLPNLGAIVTALNEETLNTAYADAEAALAEEDVTLQELVAAMQNITTAAQAVAPEHLQNLKGYAVKYGATDAATLIDNALAAIEAGNVAQIIATMTAVKEAATPLAQQVLSTMIGYVQAFGLTEQAAQAQAALDGGNYITMITTAKALFTHLIAAANEYLPKLGAIVEGLNDETLNTAYAAAQELLAKESITPEELAAAMQNIITAAKAVAPEHLQNLKGYAVKYGATDAATLVDDALAAIEAGNVAQIISTMTAVKEAATPLAQQVLSTMIGYVQAFGLTEQAAQAQAALEGGNYITMITTAKALFTHLIAAAQEYLPKLGAIATGLNDETLNTAYAAAQELLAKESITPEELAAAMQNIITAAKAVAPEHLQNLKGYAEKYGAEDAASLITLIDNALAAIEAGNVAQIIATMTAVKEAATPLATAILTQMIEKAQSYTGFEEDITEAQAALESGNYITMITAAKALYAKLQAAATGVGSMKAAFEKDVWYDLNGHKLNGKPTKKGVYFINGKKVVI